MTQIRAHTDLLLKLAGESHGAVPADRQDAHRVQGAVILLCEEGRPHTNGELLHVDMVQLRQGEMSQLVEKDDKAED